MSPKVKRKHEVVPGHRETMTRVSVGSTMVTGGIKMTLKDGAMRIGSPVRKVVKKRSPSNRLMKAKKKVKV